MGGVRDEGDWPQLVPGHKEKPKFLDGYDGGGQGQDRSALLSHARVKFSRAPAASGGNDHDRPTNSPCLATFS